MKKIKSAQQTQQKAELKPKKRFSYYKLILYSSLLVILILPVVVVLSQTLSPDAGIQRPLSGTQSSPRDYPFVNPAEECYVHNKTTAVTYMVPYRSAMEWAAFKSFASKNASSIEVDCDICTPKTCADKTGLAAINNGFNCGSLLNDGCGGTLNCMDNCEVGEVCSNGAINSACDLGDISDCGGNNRVKGHCEIDNGCTPIIDFAIIDANKHGRMGCVSSGPYLKTSSACGLYNGPEAAIFWKGPNCSVGPSNGVGLTECGEYFAYDPYRAIFYAMTDDDHRPNVSYLNTDLMSIENCSVGGGYTPPYCRDEACYEDCMNPYSHINCFDLCCTEPLD